MSIISAERNGPQLGLVVREALSLEEAVQKKIGQEKHNLWAGKGKNRRGTSYSITQIMNDDKLENERK